MALIAQYAGVGETCPLFDVGATNGGSLTAGTIYFSFQLQNRAGFNKPSVSGAIAYSTNQKIIITIPEMPDGWDVHYFVVSAGVTNDPSTHVQIARVAAFQYGIGIEPQSVKTLLPAVLELTRSIHTALAPSVTSVGSLPSGADRLDGQVRFITALSIFVEYRANSNLPLSPDVIAADIGQWVRVGGPSTYVSDTRAGVGSDRPINSINPITTIPTPPYPGETLSKYLPAWEAKYWIYNDSPNAIPAGTEFGIELEYNNKRSPDLLSGLFMVKFIGFVKADGSIRTQDGDGRDFPNCGADFPWTPKLTTPFITIDDLQPTEAIALAVKPFFAAAEFTVKDIIGVFPATRVQSGDYNPVGLLLSYTQTVGGVIIDVGDRYRVVPNFGLSYDVLRGIPLIGSYNPPEKPRRTFGNLQPNLAGQKVVINGNGDVFTESPSYTRTSSEGIRAIVSTLAGESSPGGWSGYVAITAGATLILSYPCTVNGVGMIRANYPDVIADDISKNKGLFNPFSVNIYLQRQDTLEIRRFSGFGVVAASSQQFTISNWAAGVVSDLLFADDDFSLFAPLTGAIAPAITGNFPSTSYRVSYSFVYDGNQITSISHASPPCVYEFEGELEPGTIEVNPAITILDEGEPPTVINAGTITHAYLTFAFPPATGGGVNFERILIDSSGNIVVSSDGNIIYI
ncbi:hypothetical protein [Nostoc punctiforme]|uniref:Uncharacterized protein n=2 Tax=Nostoc punctiforme TaxID=272131 RepID=B2ITA2_NOSP7|nr:hypothetical protein [Nostoc punctiforme]ACC81133.1 hypothetical protein Npun_R2579 [Nostoc punctiforme PCC 73102]RCJ29180.1 hypothetical protein A6769_35895 [Nostoc punctiforme NIES-2108]